MRCLPRFACLLAGLAAVTVAAAQPAVPVAPPPHLKRLSDAEVARLIAQVGSPSFAERETATAELSRRPEAAAAVEKALAAATTPEAVRRLGGVSAALKRDWARRRLAKLPDYVKHRQFDRLVETMVLCREHLTDEHDQHVRAFIKGVYDDATGGKPHRGTSGDNWIDFGTFAGSQRKPNPFDDRRLTLIDRTARVDGLRVNVVATDRVGKIDPNADQQDGFSRCVILCNGTVNGYAMSGGVLIASDHVRIPGIIDHALILTPGDVTTAVVDSSVIVAGGTIESLQSRQSIVRSSDAEFFRSWRLFSAADTGGVLVSAFGTVWLQDVSPFSPFGRTGVQVGDVLAKVDGIPVRSVRDAHRLLCRAAVGRGEARLDLIRDSRAVAATAILQAWE